MPKSSLAGKEWSYQLLLHLHRQAPLQRVLDVGPGLGLYSQFRLPGQHWTAVEAWAPYIQTYNLASLYDKVIVADIRYLDWRRIAPVDLVIFGDILEHMSKEDSLDVLEEALAHSRVVLVSLPVVFSDQGDIHGNPFEIHVKPDWTHRECMQSFPDICVGMQEDVLGIYFLSRSANDRRILETTAMGGTEPPEPQDLKSDHGWWHAYREMKKLIRQKA